MGPVDKATRDVIVKNRLCNWLKDYPWLVGYLGKRRSPVWFVAENPSLRGVVRIHSRSSVSSKNLQWNAHAGDWLFREALVKAGLKKGNPRDHRGWECYITDVIKEPEVVKERNEKKRDPSYWRTQACQWLPVFLEELRLGRPRVLVAVGNPALKILKYWAEQGVLLPRIEQIPHYSYVMFRPDNKAGLGPGHPERKKAFITVIVRIKKRYSCIR